MEAWQVLRSDGHVGIENHGRVTLGSGKTLECRSCLARPPILTEELDITIRIFRDQLLDAFRRAIGRCSVDKYQFGMGADLRQSSDEIGDIIDLVPARDQTVQDSGFVFRSILTAVISLPDAEALAEPGWKDESANNTATSSSRSE